MRTAILGIAAGVVLAAASLPAAAQSVTRIEPRPFYGATVTIEEGVRVFRALPPHERIIINPDNKTPLSLGFSTHYSYSYGQNNVQYVDGGHGGYGGYSFGGFRHGNKHGPRSVKVGKH